MLKQFVKKVVAAMNYGDFRSINIGNDYVTISSDFSIPYGECSETDYWRVELTRYANDKKVVSNEVLGRFDSATNAMVVANQKLLELYQQRQKEADKYNLSDEEIEARTSNNWGKYHTYSEFDIAC